MPHQTLHSCAEFFHFCARPQTVDAGENVPAGNRQVAVPKNFAPYVLHATRSPFELRDSFQVHIQHQCLAGRRVGTSRPHIILKVVDLPAPFGPGQNRRANDEIPYPWPRMPNFFRQFLRFNHRVSPAVPSTVCRAGFNQHLECSRSAKQIG